jgi:hypothetical protein
MVADLCLRGQGDPGIRSPWKARLNSHAAATIAWNGFKVAPETAIEGIESLWPGQYRVFDLLGNWIISIAMRLQVSATKALDMRTSGSIASPNRSTHSMFIAQRCKVNCWRPSRIASSDICSGQDSL